MTQVVRSERFSGALSPFGGGGAAGISKSTRRELGRVGEVALVAEAVEMARGLVTNPAMTDAAAVAVTEAACVQLAPHAAGRFQAIADAHAVGAVGAVTRFRG